MTGALPLSAGQEAIWFAYSLQPDSAAYNVAIAVGVHGGIDAAALSGAVRAVAARHELLRSVFTEDKGQVLRRLCPASRARLAVRDVAELGPAAQAELARPFRLDTELPFRVSLLRGGATGSVLLIVAHHIVTDADSQLYLLRDLLDAYLAITAGGQPRWSPLPCGYADYVRAERELLASPRAAVLERYWREACGDAALALALPADYSRPAVQAFAGAQHEFLLEGELMTSVRASARTLGVTLFAYLLGTFQALLYRYTAQPDFLIGYVSTTRQRKTREAVGYFINSLPVRARIDTRSTMRAIVTAANDSVRAGTAHRELPLAAIARALRAPRDPGRLSTFQVLFSMVVAYPPNPLFYLTSAGGRLDYGGLTLTRFDVPQQQGQFDLTVDVIESGSSMRVVVKYSTRVFSRERISDLARHFVAMLTATAADPCQVASGVPVVAGAGERARLLALARGGQ
jgi:Condensation domain